MADEHKAKLAEITARWAAPEMWAHTHAEDDVKYLLGSMKDAYFHLCGYRDPSRTKDQQVAALGDCHDVLVWAVFPGVAPVAKRTAEIMEAVEFPVSCTVQTLAEQIEEWAEQLRDGVVSPGLLAGMDEVAKDLRGEEKGAVAAQPEGQKARAESKITKTEAAVLHEMLSYHKDYCMTGYEWPDEEHAVMEKIALLAGEAQPKGGSK